jgi:hypothetical protein
VVRSGEVSVSRAAKEADILCNHHCLHGGTTAYHSTNWLQLSNTSYGLYTSNNIKGDFPEIDYVQGIRMVSEKAKSQKPMYKMSTKE